MKKYGVYILKGKRYYVGYTGDIDKRLEEHKKGTTKTIRELGNWKFIKFIECGNKTEAIKLERRIKKGGHIERWCS